VFDVRATRDADEYRRAFYGIGQYFNGPLTQDQFERFTQILPLERMHAAFEAAEIVGGAGAFPFELSVPGGRTVRCGGVTVVGVYPTHRRRGALRAMMTAQLHDLHERREAIAALWASEETIYGRFGYGLASWAGDVRIDRAWSAFAQPLERRGRLRFVEPDEALRTFPAVWETLARERPGVFSRSPQWWELRTLRMPQEESEHPRRFVALELDGAVEGYAIYRQFPSFEQGSSNARLEVREAVGATPQATAEIWRFLLDVDWYGTLEASLLPPDHPLFLLLANPRRAVYRMGDALWVRLVDVGPALAARAYRGDGSVVLEVRDAMCPWNEGRWRVASDGSVERTNATPELALDVSALGAAYLGAVSFAQLRSALRVEELADGAVERADALFAWRPLPWCPEIF
jgi:predicted acetyltransferase